MTAKTLNNMYHYDFKSGYINSLWTEARVLNYNAVTPLPPKT